MLRQSLKRLLQVDAGVFISLAKEGSMMRGLPLHAQETLGQLPISLARAWDWHDRRPYADGVSGDDKPPIEGLTEAEQRQSDEAVSSLKAASAALQAHTGKRIDTVDEALDAWGTAMDEGDWEAAWNIFEGQFPVDGPDFPPLEELLAWDPDSEERAVRRQREEAMQEETARARLRKVDQKGRAHAVGKRKASVARVWLREGPGHIMVNRRPYDGYFVEIIRRNDVITPFFVTDTLGRFDVMAAVNGGGVTGQAQALRHGIARALQLWDPALRPALKAAGLLTRDPRVVERKKPGLKKARKAFQWVKR